MRTVLLVLLVGCGAGRTPVEAEAPIPRRTLEGVPPDVASWYLRAVVAEEMGDLEEAQRALGWVVRLDRSSPWSWYAQGGLAERHGDLGQALSSYVQAQERTEAPEVAEAVARVRAALCEDPAREPPPSDWGCGEEGS